MSVPYPAGGSLPERDTAATDVAVKPFRSASLYRAPVEGAWNRLRSLYNDKRDWNRAIGAAIAMSMAIGASVLGKLPGTYAGFLIFVVAILFTAATDAWAGLLLFVVYLNLEGMFKYTTLFSTVVYAVAPCLGLYIFATWRLNTRAREARAKTAQVKTIVDASQAALITQTGDKGIALPPLAAWVFALILLMVVQIFNPESAGYVSATAGTLVWYLAPIALFFVAYYSVTNSKQLVAFTYLMVGVAFVVSAYAMVQYFLGQEWCYAHIEGLLSVNRMGWYLIKGETVTAGSFRPVSTYASPGGYVGTAELGIIACLCVSQMDKMPPVRRVLVLALALVMAVAIMMAGVRLAVVNTVLMVPLALFLSVRNFKEATRTYFLSFVIVGGALLAFVLANTLTDGKIGKRLGNSLSDPVTAYKKNRGYHFETLGEAIAVRPLGIGVQRGAIDWKNNRRNRLSKELEPLIDRETMWNSIHADEGIFGVIIVGGFFIAILRQGYRYCRAVKHPRLQLVTVFLYVVVVSTFVSCFGAPALQSNAIFWISCGLLLAVPRIYAREDRFVQTGTLLAELTPVPGAPEASV